MRHIEYLAIQDLAIRSAAALVEFPLKELQEQAEMINLTAPITSPELYEKEKEDLKDVRELIALMREFQEAAKIIFQRIHERHT